MSKELMAGTRKLAQRNDGFDWNGEDLGLKLKCVCVRGLGGINDTMCRSGLISWSRLF
jgi:hypothetical protein